MLLRHRAHEWLADRLPFMQYPNIRREMQRRAARGPVLSWERRLGLGMVGTLGLLLSMLILGVALFSIYLLLTN